MTPTAPDQGDQLVSSGAALSDAELARLVAGDLVVVRRRIPAGPGRAEQREEWLVEVAELHHWPGEDGWSLVHSWSEPSHRLEFHIGLACFGMRTEVFRSVLSPNG